MELVANPSTVFMDEPTSGARLATRGQTAVASRWCFMVQWMFCTWRQCVLLLLCSEARACVLQEKAACTAWESLSCRWTAHAAVPMFLVATRTAAREALGVLAAGLDARAAAIVMRSVRNIVSTGRTIVCKPPRFRFG